MRSLLSFFLRGNVLAAKFLLISLLIKILPSDKFAFFGLFSAFVVYFQVFAGFEFYSFSIRQMVKSGGISLYRLRDQSIIYVFSYFLLIPIVFFFVGGRLVDSGFVLIILCYFIVVLEHVAQELYRLQIASGLLSSANFALFLRSALWVYFLFILYYFDLLVISLNVVFFLWLIGQIGAIFCSAFSLRKSVKRLARVEFDFAWIRNGFVIAFPIFISSLSYRALFLLDRYVISIFESVNYLSAYIFFISFANAMYSMMEAVFFAKWYPEMLNVAKERPFGIFSAYRNNLLKKTGFFSALSGVIVGVFVWIFIGILDKSFLYDYASLLIMTIFLGFLFCLHYPVNGILYATEKDKLVLQINAEGILLFPLLIFLFEWLVIDHSVIISLQIVMIYIVLRKYKAISQIGV